MTENYIDTNFDKIISYASTVEDRLDDSDCTIEGLKADNKKYITEFGDVGERIVLIHTNYEQEINELLDNGGVLI
jgi:hypothetical protein